MLLHPKVSQDFQSRREEVIEKYPQSMAFYIFAVTFKTSIETAIFHISFHCMGGGRGLPPWIHHWEHLILIRSSSTLYEMSTFPTSIQHNQCYHFPNFHHRSTQQITNDTRSHPNILILQVIIIIENINKILFSWFWHKMSLIITLREHKYRKLLVIM